QLRLDLSASRESPAMYHGMHVDRGGLLRVRQEARSWAQLVKPQPRSSAPMTAAMLLALAYPDRVAQRRSSQPGRFLLRNGQGAETSAPSLALSDYIGAAQLDGDRRQSRLWLGAPITLGEIRELFHDQIESRERVEWIEPDGFLKAAREERLDALVLAE